MNVIPVVLPSVPWRGAVYLLPFTLVGLLFVVVTVVPKEMEPLTIVPRRTFDFEL